jgi:hypothetical protein
MLTSSALAIQFEHASRKFTPLSESCVALTAGDALAHTELFDAVRDEIAKIKAPSMPQVVETIKECYQSIRKKEIEERILRPKGIDGLAGYFQVQRSLVTEIAFNVQSQIDNYDYGLEVLVGGVNGKVARIFGISNPGTSECYDAIGFHAIGSGLPHALNTLIARGCHRDISLAQCLVTVYEAKKMAEKAPGVGAAITDLCVVDNTGIYDWPQNGFDQLCASHERWVKEEPGWDDGVNALLAQKKGWKREAP